MFILKKLERRKEQNHNEGFSLVEVLCAIVILGLIAAPILQMFYSSSAMNQKSKKYLAAADLAQTIMEGVSAQTWDKTTSVNGTLVYDGLKVYYKGEDLGDNLAHSGGTGDIFKNPISGHVGPKYDSYYAIMENGDGAHLANLSQNKCYAYYFSGVHSNSFNKPFYCKLTFDTRNYKADGFYPIEVTVDVYSYDAKDTAPDFNINNVSKFTLIKSVSTYIPNSRSRSKKILSVACVKSRRMTMKKKIENFRVNNKGVALISIMIAVAFISIIASALLYITYTNFQMKTMNLNSKENFYEVDGQLTRITTGVRQEVKSSSGEIDNRVKSLMNGNFSTPVGGVSNGSYSLKKMAQFAYDNPKNESEVEWYEYDAGSGNYVKKAYDDIADEAKRLKAVKITRQADGTTRRDEFYYRTETSAINKKYDASSKISTYTFDDFKVLQKHKDSKIEAPYQNCVKTVIEFKALELAGGNAGSPGGIGEFSMLSDSNLASNGGFSCLNVNGNCYFSSKNNNIDTNWQFDELNSEKTVKGYTAPGKASDNNPGIKLDGEAKLNMSGDYLVVFGDLVLDGKSCLYLNSGCKLTVYGDIIFKDRGLLIASEGSEIYMLKNDSFLPGRDALSPCKIVAEDGNLQKHLYPYDITVKDLTVDDYKAFAKTIGLADEKTDNDGVQKQIFKAIEHFGGTVNGATHLREGGITFDIRKGDAPKDERFGKSKYYGQDCGVFYYTQGNMNDICNDALIINFDKDLKVSQNAKNATIISNHPIYLEQVHSITLTKIGGPVFDFLTIKSDEDGNSYRNINGTVTKIDKNPEFDAAVHQVEICKNSGTEYKQKVSAGDFFIDNPNEIVNKMLQKSTASGSDDSTSEKSYKTSLSFTAYEKDFDWSE